MKILTLKLDVLVGEIFVILIQNIQIGKNLWKYELNMQNL